MHLTRYYMYKKIKSAFNKRLSGKILGVTEIDEFNSLIDKDKSQTTITDYPTVDMQKLPFENETFDYVISDQVLEHIENPQKAVDESYRILKKGGIAIHTTCFINYFHPSPKDYWRFSPDALKFLCRNFSEIIQCDGWGNKLATIVSLLGDRLRTMKIPERKLSIRRWLASKKDNRYMITTWIIAKK